MKYKKLQAILLAASMTLSLAACSDSATNAGGDSQTSAGGAGAEGSENATDGDAAGSSDLEGDLSDVIPEETVTLDVYDQLANYSGEQIGWFAQVMLDKFNVKLNIIPESDGVYDTRMESGNLGDIVIWGADGDDYVQAVNKGMLFDWEEDDILADYGPYILANMDKALEKNRGINADGKIYGFGHDVAYSAEDTQSVMYEWDLRFDLYQEIGAPEITDFDSLVDVLEKMQAACPTDDNGNKTYAASLFNDWDGDMVMFVKSTASAYYGYDEFGFGLYDSSTTLTGDYSGTFDDGSFKMNNTTWALDSLNPDSALSETYNYKTWESYKAIDASDIEKSWIEWSGAQTPDEYIKSTDYILAPGTTYSAGTHSDELQVIWDQVATCIKDNSWKAIYAESDEEFDAIVADMIKQATEYGYDECVEFQQNEAQLRHAAEQEALAAN